VLSRAARFRGLKLGQFKGHTRERSWEADLGGSEGLSVEGSWNGGAEELFGK